MKTNKRFGIIEFQRDFGTEAKCLKVIFQALHSSKCSCGGVYTLLKGRRQYQCSKCRFQIAPTAGTIFHKSDTPLVNWFFAIFLFSNAKSGYSAAQLQRDLKCTYKTAWRMLKLIRTSLKQEDGKLGGMVEMDETYFGGRISAGKDNKFLSKAMRAKSVIIGGVERGEKIRAQVQPNGKAKTVDGFLMKSIEVEGTHLMTDESNRYDVVAMDYNRHTVNHRRLEYARGPIHTNTIEGFWSHLKRSVSGTHKAISKKYLPSYLDAFVWHYNQRNDSDRFASLLGVLLRPAR